MSEPIKPVLNESFDNFIVIDGLPKADSSKTAKLTSFVERKFAEFNPVSSELIVDENGTSKGFMFMEFANDEDARRALSMDGKPLDRAHTFRANLFNDYETRYNKIPDEYIPLDVEQNVQPLPYLKTHLLDELVRDQFCLRYDDESQRPQTAIMRFDTYDENYIDTVYDGADQTKDGRIWTELQVAWSPKGSYLVTFHIQGAAIWGGERCARVARIAHPLVTRVEFSPCERYVLSISHPEGSDTLDIRLWEVATGALIQNFPNVRADLPWPVLRFSHDGNILARIAYRRKEEKDGTVVSVANGIAFFDIANRGLLGGKPMAIPGIVDFAFSPTQSIVAYCLIGQGQLPSRLIIYDYVNKRVLRDNPTFGVESWSLHWQGSGDILVVSMTRKKDRRAIVHAIDAYFIRKKNIPLIEIIVDNKPERLSLDPVYPLLLTSTKTVHGHAPKVDFHMYNISEQSIKQIWTETSPVPTNADLSNFHTLWSPAGQTLVIATVVNTGTTFFIVDASKPTPEIRAADLELNHGNYISFDSSGRYIAVASTRDIIPPHLKHNYDPMNYHGAWRKNIQDAYAIYTFQGDLLTQQRVAKLYQFLWRPFTLDKLSFKEIRQVKNDLKSKHWDKYNALDDKHAKVKKQAVARRRQELKAAWREFRAIAQEEYIASREHRQELQGGYASDVEDDDDYEITVLDEQWYELPDEQDTSDKSSK